MSMIEMIKDMTRKGDQYIEKYGPKEFYKYATDALSNSGLVSVFDHQEVIKSILDAEHGHKQNFKNLEFSDLPVTLSRGNHCFIDVYYWRRRPTVIHDHHFTGAFMCLEGRNLDLEFHFHRTSKLGKFHDLGSVEIIKRRTLGPGDVSGIALLDEFIHQNHHQADLTVNLCFRTPENPEKSLSNYLYSGLRFEKNQLLLGRVRRLRKLLDLGFSLEDVMVTDDDAISFLIQNHGTASQNPRLLSFIEDLDKRIKNSFGIDISELIQSHERELEKLEVEYE